jgi:hypothetical protein
MAGFSHFGFSYYFCPRQAPNPFQCTPWLSLRYDAPVGLSTA